ncbi:MAG TPA: bacillithiol biosynthesis deacetylase BshB1 [Longimicrobiales bacterium]
MSVDLLAIMAHPDDAELLCGGTLARTASLGYRVAILDLTAGESGSFGDRDTRAHEAAKAAKVLGVAVRRSAGLPDGRLENSGAARASVATLIRELRPRTVVLHWPEARHPDHAAASAIGRDACFLAGVKNAADVKGEAYRPHKLIYALTYQEAYEKPSFVVDITEFMDRKLEAIFAVGSQFAQKTKMGDVLGGGSRPLRDQILAHHAHYGSLIRKEYGEPFWVKETIEIGDVVEMPVNSM